MANVLTLEKQVSVISALAEGMSIRSTERMLEIHRDSIMRLGVRVGQGCERMLDSMMRNLNCERIQVDEIWGYVGRKQRNITSENANVSGDAWTFVAIDADSKLVPSFRVGKRDSATATEFVSDLSSRFVSRNGRRCQ